MTIAVSHWIVPRPIDAKYSAACLGDGGASFSEMLLGIDDVQSEATSAAAFNALGVFGRAAAVDAPKVQPPVTDGPLPIRPADWSVEGREKIDAAQILTVSKNPPTVAASAGTVALPNNPANLFVVQEGEFASPSVVPVTALTARRLEAASNTRDIETSAGTLPLQSDPKRSRFMMPRVAIHTEGSKAYIVVHSDMLDGDSHMRLRRRIAAVLSEHGLDVEEFVADGVVVGQSFDTETGGAHGHFKR